MSEKQFEELKELFNRLISEVGTVAWLIFWGLVINGCLTRR
jgi:hypothetical protein